jgi:hypothetical protein
MKNDLNDSRYGIVGHFEAEEPKKIRYRLSISMSLGNWSEIKDTLSDARYNTAGYVLRGAIVEMINEANTVHFPNDQGEAPND